jgi:hypothetical protein
MLRKGDTVSVIEGLDANRKGLVTDVVGDFITCSPLEGDAPYSELYGIPGEYTFNKDNLQLLISKIEPKDIIVVRETTIGGKKNVNKKARPGMKGTVVDVTTHFSRVDFGEAGTFRVGTKLLDRVSFTPKKVKLIDAKVGDIIVFNNGDNKRIIGKVRGVSIRDVAVRLLDGTTKYITTVDIKRRIKLSDMIKKAVVSESSAPQGLDGEVTIDKGKLKDELKRLYEDELLIDRLTNKSARNRAKETVANVIKDTLTRFHSSKKMMCYPGGLPFYIGTAQQAKTTIKKRRDRIKDGFFKYLQWKIKDKPKLLVQEVPSLFDFILKKSGNVNAVPGQYLEFKKYLEDGSLIDKGKSPGKLRDNYLGIEIECYVTSTHEELKESLVASGLAKYVDVTTDGSLRPDEGQVNTELRVLVKESMCSDVLQAILNVVNSHGGSVNHACGIHVHLDMRHRNPQECYTRLYGSINHLFSAIPRERRGNEYCVPNRYNNIERQSRYMQENYSGRFRRYAAINTLSVGRHSTLEVRTLEGTLDHRTICHWIDTLISIINTDVQSTDDLDNFLSQLNNYTDTQKQLFRQRVEEFTS